MSLPSNNTQLISTVSADGKLNVALTKQAMPTPKAHEVLVRIEAAPINPSDLGVMFGWSDMNQATSSGSGSETTLTAPVPPQGMQIMRGRVDQPLPLGNEGAGTVVAAGDDEYAQSLVGKVVALFGGGMYSQYRCVPAQMCLPLLPGHDAKDGASAFVNPLTALAMVETMRVEGHTALVHTAAASNLGQMLNRICLADDVKLVNIVRRPEQAKLLREIGAQYIVDSTASNFRADLTDAIHETGATLGFDAIGGGTLADTLLIAMEAALARSPGNYSIYGSVTHKQVYVYGSLDPSPTVLNRAYGMAWGVGGFLLPNFLAKAGAEVGARLRQRVASELKTTFASHYTDEISLSDALLPEVVKRYNAKTTGEKFLIRPQQSL